MRRVFKNRYDLLKNHIGKLRGLDSLRVAEIFEQRPDMIINAASAQQYGLIDGVSSWDQLKQKLGIEDDDKLVSLEDYNDPKIVPGGQIALINLSGNIAARNRLAKLYMAGIGTEPDAVSAGAWTILARRAGLTDPVMSDFMDGLSAETEKKALAKANLLR